MSEVGMTLLDTNVVVEVRREYVVQWHDGDGQWIDDGGTPEEGFDTRQQAEDWLRENAAETIAYGYRFRIVERTTITTEMIVEERPRLRPILDRDALNPVVVAL